MLLFPLYIIIYLSFIYVCMHVSIHQLAIYRPSLSLNQSSHYKFNVKK